jgi:hypothetical protein
MWESQQACAARKTYVVMMQCCHGLRAPRAILICIATAPLNFSAASKALRRCVSLTLQAALRTSGPACYRRSA